MWYVLHCVEMCYVLRCVEMCYVFHCVEMRYALHCDEMCYVCEAVAMVVSAWGKVLLYALHPYKIRVKA